MLIGIIQVESWSQTFGAGFLSWTKTVADRMKRIAIRNPILLTMPVAIAAVPQRIKDQKISFFTLFLEA